MPVAIASGYSEDEVIERFGPDRISGFIQKPFTSDRLLGSVSELLRSIKAGARPA
jgi:hypothetical protein